MDQNQLPDNLTYQKLHDIFFSLAKRRVRNEDDAEEIVQDALMTIVEKHGEQDYQTGFLQWAFGVLRNKIGNYYQKRDRRSKYSRAIEDDDVRVKQDQDPNPLDVFTESELRHKMTAAWLQLNEHCRKLLWMLYRGYSREEIARAFPQYHFKVVNTKIFRCRNYLRRLLRKEGYSV